jgi:hypothetical protein
MLQVGAAGIEEEEDIHLNIVFLKISVDSKIALTAKGQ